MKGPIAAMLEALALLGRAGISPCGEVLLTLAADEETGGALGTGYLAGCDLLGPADAGICGEPTSLDAVVASRGRLWLEITTLGRSAHSSRPDLGENAITAMVRVLEALERLALPTDEHPLVGHATLTPTVVAGGASANSVPDRCTVTLDRRFLPSESAASALRQIAELVERVGVEHHFDIQLSEQGRLDASEIDEASEIVSVVQAATQEMARQPARIAGMAGSTDARFLIGAGIPTVIFGPGDLADAHTVDESISIDALIEGCLCYAATICRFLGVRQ